MKKANVNVEYTKNWANDGYATYSTKDYKNIANDGYATYSTKDYKNIAELDFPTKGRSEFRVYKGNGSGSYDIRYTIHSSLPAAIRAAEQACKSFLLNKKRYVEKFNYPKEITESFKVSE